VPACAGRRAATIAVLAALGGSYQCAWPQQVSADSAQDAIVVTGHYDNAVGTSDAASEGSITAKLIEDQPLLRPGETLEFIPGMVVTQHSGDGKANQYFLRGYNLDHGTDFAPWIDGVPVNMPTNAHGQGYADVNYLIPELVQRIDYRKGPYYARDGDFSSAGAADVLYRSSLDRSLADLTVGAFDYRRALFAGSTSPAGASGGSPVLLGALELARQNGPWTLAEGLQKINALLRLSDGSRANGWSIDGVYYDAHWSSTDQVPLSLIDSGQLGRYASLDPTDGGDTGRQILSAEWHQSDGDSYARISAYAQHYRLQLWSDFTYFELRPATGDQFEQAERRDLFGAQMLKGWTHGLFGRESATEVGFQLRYDHIHVGLFDTQARTVFQTVSDNVVGQTEAGAYVQNSTTWTPWLRSVLGLRNDAIVMNVDALTIPENSGSASGSKISPKLSVIFGPWAKTELFFNSGRGFHSNDARGVTEKVDATTGLPPPSAVPALVGSLGREIGLRTQAVPGLQSSLALWCLDSDGELVYSADSDIGNTSPNGPSRRYGAEWSNHWVPNRWLILDADMAWVHARYAIPNDNGESGDLIPNAVGKVGRLGVTISNLGPWSASVSTRYIGPYPLVQDGSLWAPSAIVTNLRLERRLAPDATFALDVLNLFDRQYYDIAYGQDYQLSPASPAVQNGVTVHPGEPRQVRAALNLRF